MDRSSTYRKINGMYAINKLHVSFRIHTTYVFTVSMTGAQALLMCALYYAIVVGPAKCGHVTKTLVACKRRGDFGIFPEIGSCVAFSFYL